MANWLAQLDQAPRLPAKESALQKVREAEFFLEELRRRDRGSSIEFRYTLNAFMAPARAAQKFLRKHNEAGFDAWEASLQPRDRDVLSVLRAARDLAIHEDGASLVGNVEPTYVPTPGGHNHTFRLRSPDGTVQIMPAVNTCARSLALVRMAYERL
jgi:hypothetical protein